MTDKLIMFQNRLTKVYRHLSRIASKQSCTCYRVYDHDIPEFPFSIELYDQHIYMAEYKRAHGMEDDAHEQWLDECIEIVSKVLDRPVEHIYLKERQRKEGRLGQYQKTGTENENIVVSESGLQFIVNLSDYLDTGLFLDHRITRSMVREQSAGKRVLNLFCYTGSFSVYAAAGGASKVTSVDLSKTYLSWARENMKLNQLLNAETDDFIHADVKQYLDTLRPASYDIIVMDPPTFSNSKRMKDFLDIQRDHADMINQALMATTPGGTIYFSTNFRRFVLEEDKIRHATIRDITKSTTPFDFQGKLFRWCYKIVKN